MATTAKTKKEVEQMNTSDRLWDSLNHSYGLQREEIGRNYDKAYSQADRQALSRGMQRSSYNAQNLANINEQRNNALSQNYSNQIADYENRLTQQEQLDKENERWERQFAEGQRQFDAGQQLQREENALNRAFQTSEREAQQGWQSGENALNRAFNTSEREAQQNYNTSERIAQQQFSSAENAAARDWQAGQTAAQQAWQSGENALNRAYNTAEREAQQTWQTGENERNRAYNTAERIAQQSFQSGENALSRAENARQFNEQMAYNQAQADRSADQWERSFNQDNMTADQKLAASYVAAIAEQGGTPSDALLARAGLSRADAEAMRKGGKSSGSGGSGTSTSNPGSNPPSNPNDLFNDPTGNPAGTPAGTTPTLTKEEMAERLRGADGKLYEEMFGPSAEPMTSVASQFSDEQKEMLKRQFQEYMEDPYAVVDFTPEDGNNFRTTRNPSVVWTEAGPTDLTQVYSAAFNTNDIANDPAVRLTSRTRDTNIIDPNAETAEERFNSTRKRKKNYQD